MTASPEIATPRRTPREEKTLRLRDVLQRQLGGLQGPLMRALNDVDITDIQRNQDGRLWLHSHERGRIALDYAMSDADAESFLKTVAGMLNVEFGIHFPTLAAELPLDGNRLQGFCPPVVSAPAFAIRKRPQHIYTLEQYEDRGILSPSRAKAVRQAIELRRNFLISGGTGSGKTTLANALLAEIVAIAPPSTRFVIIEDLLELQCSAPNCLSLRTTTTKSLRDLLKDTLRSDPDRVIIGEVRGAEAYDLLKAWNTGHPGNIATLHANSARGALSRLDHLAQEAGVPSQVYEIAAANLAVVHIEGKGAARRVTEVLAVDGLLPDNSYNLEALA